MRIIASYAIKGGVGKTATAVNLAWEAWRGGASVLVWDMDPQGAASFYFRVAPDARGGAKQLVKGDTDVASLVRGSDYDGLDVLPADFTYRHLDLYLDAAKRPTRRLVRLLAPLAERYDYAVLDCAPGITLTSESVFALADALIVPTVPTTLSLRTLDQLAAHLRKHDAGGAVTRPFLSMVDRRKALHRALADAILDGGLPTPFPFLRTVIPYLSAVERMGTQRAPVGVFAPGDAAATAYRALWGEVREVVGGR
ncbi:MAG: ParA family protein [Ardenticatenales bacterium]|nr:ParA family protein [Ardenticatenales bacterium]